ncbi:uncharacterized protein [Amphiura filiformis]|uniref:uncharacterized protein n=1 Tax=Amphiura filiformis TaxID=82378 RepID=UPI003B22279D
METIDFDSYFNGFGRSFNRSVLVNDDSIRYAYQNALNNGIGECNRLRTVIVGDKGVGKTSTLQMLTGGQCDPTIEPKSTEGIEITTCETSDLIPEWTKGSDDLRSDDPRLAASWCVFKEENSLKGAPKDGVNPVSPRTQNDPRNLKQNEQMQDNSGEQQCGLINILIRSARNKIADSGVLLKEVLPVIIMTTLVYNGLGSEIGTFMLLTILASRSVFCDFNRAYRNGIVFALHAIVVDVLSNDMILDIQLSDLNLLLGSLIRLLLCCSISGVFGFMCGFGGRTGMAIAFCLMTRPKTSSVDSDWKQKAPHIILLFSGYLLGTIFVKELEPFIRIFVRWLLQKRLLRFGGCFMLFVVTFMSLKGCYVYSLLIGCIMGVNIIALQYAWELTAKKTSIDGYLKKKRIGFIAATTFGHLMGFKLNAYIGLSQMTCITLFILRDLYFYFRIKKAQNEGIPIHIFRKQIMTSSRGQDATVMKLIVWDFAGDSIYQGMQQYFLPEKAVYLLAFSFEMAWENPRQQVERLKQWLYTIKAHSMAHDALVFIVGTHRDSVKHHVGFLNEIAEQLRKSLYNEFCGILAINANYESPLFVVENSLPIDEDGVLLRETITRKAKERPFLKQKQPVKFLRLLNMIKQWKSGSEGRWYIERESFLEKAGRKGFEEEEVESFLRFCHFSGEFIYRNDDEVMRNYVILDPQHLLDIMKQLLKFPLLSERLLENAENWLSLQTNGVASVDLLTEIVGDYPELVNTITRFLEAYNMLLPIGPGNTNNFTHGIVPSHLPEEPALCWDWDSADDDEEYLFDFGYVPSEAIFYRLLARCWYHNRGDAQTNGRLYHQRGIFCFKDNSIFFMLQLQIHSINQQLIRVVVQSTDEQQRYGFQVLQWITGELEDIRKKDFPHLPYRLGPRCKMCSEGQDTIKVLEICGNGKEFPTANSPVKKLLVDGRYHEVYMAPKLSVSCGRKNRRSSSESSSSSAAGDNGRHQGAVAIGEGSNNVVIKAGDNTQINLQCPDPEIQPDT